MAAEETSDWLKYPEACRVAQVSRRVLNRLAAAGQIARTRTSPKEAWTYSRHDCERYAEHDGGEVEQSEMLGQAYQHIGQLMAPNREALEVLREENHRLRARCEHLETHVDRLQQAREDLLDRKLERDLAASHANKVDDRKERAFKVVETHALPKLLTAITGGNHPAMKLLDSLTEDQLTLLLNTDLITPDQQKLLKSVLKDKGAEIVAEGEEQANG